MSTDLDWVTIHQVGDRLPFMARIERPSSPPNASAFSDWQSGARLASFQEYPILLVVKDTLGVGLPLVALERYCVEQQKLLPVISRDGIEQLQQDMQEVDPKARPSVITPQWLAARGVVFPSQDQNAASKIRNPITIPAEAIPWIDLPVSPVISPCDSAFAEKTVVAAGSIKRVSQFSVTPQWLEITRSYVADAKQGSESTLVLAR